jgi:glycosyltransferase involved in cell wall biosynthesis
VGELNYGQRAHSVRELLALPTLTEERIMPALAIHPDERADLDTLAANGWHLLDPSEVAATPATYRSFVQGSKAELGVAKKGYVVSRCGWFSDRSACYLASGRPVIAQDTGFDRRLPTGAGLIAYSTAEDVIAAIEELDRDYERHRAAARQVAAEHLDSDRVLGSLLERLSP